MDFRITSDKIGKHMEYDWYKYILIVIISIAVWLGVYSVLDNPKEYERIDIFVVASAYNDIDTEIEDIVWSTLSKTNDDVVRKVGVSYMVDRNQLYTVMLTNDIFIVEESEMGFVPALMLNDEIKALCGLSDSNQYYYPTNQENEISTTPTAVRFDGARVRRWLASSIKQDVDGQEVDVEQVYYIGLIAPNMIGGGENIGAYNKKPTNNDQAFGILKSILEFYLD